VHEVRATQPVGDEGEPLGRFVPVAELLVDSLREDPELLLEEDRERHVLSPAGLFEPLVLPFDLLDEQTDVRPAFGRLEVHQLLPRPVQVVREEEDLVAKPIEV
jgi:hypothetical protein